MRQPRSWRTQRRMIEFEHPIVRTTTVEAVSEEGGLERRRRLVLEADDWVNVIAILEPDDLWPGGPEVEEQSLLLIRQWRFGSGSLTLEIPGGAVDPGESPADAAQRELLEETGFSCSSVAHLGTVEPNPALFSNHCHTFLATGLEWQGPAAGDGEEEIELFAEPLAQVTERVKSGSIRHALVLAALHFYFLAGAHEGGSTSIFSEAPDP